MQGVGDIKMDGDGDIVDSLHPQKSGGHVEVDAGGIDPCVGAIRIVTVKGVFYAEVTGVTGHFIHISIRAGDRHRFALLIEGFYIIDVLPEFMGSITAGRRAAHAEDGIPGGNVAGDEFDLRFMMGDIRERDDVADPLGNSGLEAINKGKGKSDSAHSELIIALKIAISE